VPGAVIAIGGIRPDGEHGVAAVIEAGAHGVAVLSGICHAEDPTRATRAYVDALARALAARGTPAGSTVGGGVVGAIPDRADVAVVGGGRNSTPRARQ